MNIGKNTSHLAQSEVWMFTNGFVNELMQMWISCKRLIKFLSIYAKKKEMLIFIKNKPLLNFSQHHWDGYSSGKQELKEWLRYIHHIIWFSSIIETGKKHC